MWVIKTRGKTFYVNHVTCDIPWSTKETPDNSHTKGSIKVKDCLLTIDDSNEAILSKLTIYDKIRLRNLKLGITRIVTAYGSNMHKALMNNEFKHSPFKHMRGGCGSSFVVCDLLNQAEVTFAKLKYDFRILTPNEAYYREYDNLSEFNYEELY